MKSILSIALVVCVAMLFASNAYIMPVTVHSVTGNEITFESADGNLWVYECVKIEDESALKSNYVLVMSNQNTTTITDDAIVCVL